MLVYANDIDLFGNNITSINATFNYLQTETRKKDKDKKQNKISLLKSWSYYNIQTTILLRKKGKNSGARVKKFINKYKDQDIKFDYQTHNNINNRNVNDD